MNNYERIKTLTLEEMKMFLICFRDGDIDTAMTFCDLCDEAAKEAGVSTECDDCVMWWLENDSSLPQGLDYRKNAPWNIKGGYGDDAHEYGLVEHREVLCLIREELNDCKQCYCMHKDSKDPHLKAIAEKAYTQGVILINILEKVWELHVIPRCPKPKQNPAEAWIEADDMEPICPCITIDANRNIHLTTEKFEVNQGRRDANGNSYDNQHFYVDGALTHGIERKEMFKSVLIYENRITHWMPLPEPPKEDTKRRNTKLRSSASETEVNDER